MMASYTIRNVLDELFRMEHEARSSNQSVTKVYFSGEFDSNRTEFEELSNQLKIGVLAPSAIIGKACLRLVRYIIDDHENSLFKRDLEDAYQHFECDRAGITRLVYYLAYTEEQYCTSFFPKDTFKIILQDWKSETTIQTTINHVDIWTVQRIQEWYSKK